MNAAVPGVLGLHNHPNGRRRRVCVYVPYVEIIELRAVVYAGRALLAAGLAGIFHQELRR